MPTGNYRKWTLAVALGLGEMFLFLGGYGCKAKDDAPSSDSAAPASTDSGAYTGTVSTAVQQEADQTFIATCAVCHGADGKGDGPGGKFLTPKPRNFTDTHWQSSVTDAHIEQVIKFGGASVGLSPAMPAHPEFMSRPDMIAALRAHVRSLNGK